jgi:hypothetical protein
VAEDPSHSGQRAGCWTPRGPSQFEPTSEVRTHRYVTRESTRDHRMVICDLRHIGSVLSLALSMWSAMVPTPTSPDQTGDYDDQARPGPSFGLCHARSRPGLRRSVLSRRPGIWPDQQLRLRGLSDYARAPRWRCATGAQASLGMWRISYDEELPAAAHRVRKRHSDDGYQPQHDGPRRCAIEGRTNRMGRPDQPP